MLWEQTYNDSERRRLHVASAVAETNRGYLLVGSRSPVSPEGETEMWLAATNTSGSALWQRSFQGAESLDSHGYAIVDIGDGLFLVFGRVDDVAAWIVVDGEGRICGE